MGVEVPVWVLGAVALLLSTCGPNPRPPDPPRTLFERLGGMAPLSRWVDELTWRLAADAELGDAVIRVDVADLKRRMLQMTCAITGGRCEYDADKLGAAHGSLVASDSDVERFLEIAERSAAAVGLPPKTRGELVERLRDLRPGPGRGDRVGSDP